MLHRTSDDRTGQYSGEQQSCLVSVSAFRGLVRWPFGFTTGFEPFILVLPLEGYFALDTYHCKLQPMASDHRPIGTGSIPELNDDVGMSVGINFCVWQILCVKNAQGGVP